MAYLKDFDLGKVTQIKAGMPKNRFWAQTICAGLLGAVLFGGSERISVDKLSTEIVPKSNLSCLFSEVGCTIKNVFINHSIDVDPSDNADIIGIPSLKKAYDSTIALVIVGKKGAFWSGTGVLLAGTNIGGHAALATVLHVGDVEAYGVKGDILGYTADHTFIGYFREYNPTYISAQTNAEDGPMMLYLDNSRPFNKAYFAHHPGVELASKVSDQKFVGLAGGGSKLNSIGATPGDSGGGMFVFEHGEYKLFALMSEIQWNKSYEKEDNEIFVQSRYAIPQHYAQDFGDHPQAIGNKTIEYLTVPKRDELICYGIASRNFDSTIRDVSNGKIDLNVTSAPYNIDHAIGIGYGRMASYVVYTSAIKSIPIDDRSNTQNASESDQKNQQVFPVSAVPY
jgi:hypothetical protein